MLTDSASRIKCIDLVPLNLKIGDPERKITFVGCDLTD